MKAGTPIEFSDIVNSELMRRLSEQRVTLRAQLAEQSSTLLDQHPRIKELRAQIADLDRQMRTEADRLARSLENDAKLASGRVDGLSSGLDQLKRQAASTNEQDVQLRALERDAKSQRDLLESYLAKYREATARDSIGATAPDARIISAAVVSNTPSWPKKLPTILVAALAMFVLSSGFVLSGELLRALPMQSVAAATPVRPPQCRPERGRGLLAAAVQGDRGCARAQAGVAPDAIEGLARDLGAAGEGARRITVVGAMRDVGTTMTAIALARSLAQQSRVVLVDLTLGAPNLVAHRQRSGCAWARRARCGFRLVRADHHARPLLPRPPDHGRPWTAGGPLDAAAIMGSQQLSIAIEALGRSYDHVVLDAGAAAEAVARAARPAGAACGAGGAGARQSGDRARARAAAAGGLCQCERAGQRVARCGSRHRRHQGRGMIRLPVRIAIRARARRRSACTAAHRAWFCLITRLIAKAVPKAAAARRPASREREKRVEQRLRLPAEERLVMRPPDADVEAAQSAGDAVRDHVREQDQTRAVTGVVRRACRC